MTGDVEKSTRREGWARGWDWAWYNLGPGILPMVFAFLALTLSSVKWGEIDWDGFIKNSVLLFLAVGILANAAYQFRQKVRLSAQDKKSLRMISKWLAITAVVTAVVFTVETLHGNRIIKDEYKFSFGWALMVQVGGLGVATVTCLRVELSK